MHGFPAVEVVPVDLHGQFEGAAGRRRVSRLFPRHAAQASALGVLGGEAEMHFLENIHLPHAQAAHAEHRLGVALAERLHLLQLAQQLLGDLGAVDPASERKARLHRATVVGGEDRGVEFCAKLIEPHLLHRDADGHRVPTPALKALLAGGERLNQIETHDAAAGAFGELALVAEHDGGAMVFARDAAGDDADDARVPALVEEHEAVRREVAFLDLRLGLLGDLALDVLPLAVERLELLRRAAAEGEVVAQQQVDRERGVGEPATGVDARPEAVRNVDGREPLLRFEAGGPHQLQQAGAARFGEHAQAMAREDAVLAEQRHEIGDGAERDEVEVIPYFDFKAERMLRLAQALKHAVHEFENEANGAKVAPRRVVGALVDVRVDQERVETRRFLGAVVVDDDNVHAEGAQVGDLGSGIGAAVERDEERGATTLERAIDGVASETVAFFESARDEIARAQSEAAENADEKGRAADAVDIVVAEHDDVLARLHRAQKAVDRRGEIGEQERITERRKRGLQEARRGVRVVESVADEQFGDDRVGAQAARERGHLVGVDRHEIPAHGAGRWSPLTATGSNALGSTRSTLDYSDAREDPAHSYLGAMSWWASTCFRSPLCHQ